MRILNRYVLESFVVTFAVTLLVVTFVMTIGALFQITDLLARGAAWRPIATIFVTGIPMALAFSIPISIVTASLLVFERLSGDMEITAMKACGISLWQAASRPLLFSVFLTVLCLYINATVSATCHLVNRETIHRHKEELARLFWEPGQFVRWVPGLTIYVDRSSYDKASGRHDISDIIIYDQRAGDVEREIRAGRGAITPGPGPGELTITLYDNVRIDPLDPARPGAGYVNEFKATVDMSKLAPSVYRKRMADLTAGELIDGIRSIPKGGWHRKREQGVYRMQLCVELNERIVISLSCIAFALLGIPLGTTTRRASSTVGIGIGFLIVFSFYVFIVLVDALAKQPELRPDLIVWAPVVVAVGTGAWLMWRSR